MPLPPSTKTKPHSIIHALLLLLICPVVFGAEWKVEWEKSFPLSEYGFGGSVIQDEDGGYVFASSIENDASLIKVDPEGNKIWEKRYNGNDSYLQYYFFNSIDKASDGGFILGGNGYDPTHADKGYDDSDPYIVKVTKTGAIEWEKTMRDYEYGSLSSCDDIIQTVDGGFVFIGKPGVKKLDSQGDLEWELPNDHDGYVSPGNFITMTPEGDLLCIYEIWSQSFDEDAYTVLYKIDLFGNIIFEKVLDTWSPEKWQSASRVSGLILSSHGGYIATGLDSLLVKYDDDFNIQWKSSFEQEAYYAQQTMDGGYIVLGSHYIYTNDDVRHRVGDVIKTNRWGSIEARKVIDRNNHTYISSIKQTVDGGYIVSGTNIMSGYEDREAYLMKLAPAPSWKFQNDLNGDSRSDLVLREKSTGQTSLLMLQDDGSTWTVSYSSNWGDKYELLGTGDLNGDGRDDMILKYNPSQTVYLCEMNETATSWNVSYYSKGFYEKYDLLGVGDLNGDGRDDLILKYKPSNTVYICLMNEPGADKIWTVAYYSQGWAEKYSILGVADLNDDARDDLILRYNKSGTVYFCHMRESGATWDIAATEIWGSALSLLALADLNGDFRKDLLVSDNEGLATAWITNENGSSWTKIPVGDWSAYDILFTGNLNADYRDDLIRQTRETKTVEFLLTHSDDPTSWTASYTADWSDVELLNGLMP